MPTLFDFPAAGIYPTFDPHAPNGPPVQMHRLICRDCGYEPGEMTAGDYTDEGEGHEPLTVSPGRCRRCGGSSLEQVAAPKSLLAFFNRGRGPVKRRRHGPRAKVRR